MTPLESSRLRDGSVWVTDVLTNKILKYDQNGRLVYSWGTYGTFPGGLGRSAFAERRPGRQPLHRGIQEPVASRSSVPKKNADKNKLVPRLLGFKWNL